MAKTILELFKDRQSAFGPRRDLYGLNGTAIIESRGLINPKRLAALAVSSPNPTADIIGGQLNGFVGGNSNRPDDNIFKDNKPFSKPITLKAPTTALLRDAVQPNTQYFVKDSPAPFQGFAAGIVKAFNNPAAFVTIGAGLVGRFGSKKGLQDLKALFAKKSDAPGYGPKFKSPTGRGKSIIKSNEYVKYSTHYTKYTPVKSDNATTQYSRKSDDEAEVISRENTSVKSGISPFDYINDAVLSAPTINILSWDDKNLEKTIFNRFEEFKKGIPGYTFVAIKLYGKTTTLVLPGTITGLSEDFAPEINSFKYVGSPFNLYRYGGVERSIKFDLKLYALDPKHEVYLRSNLDSLRKLVYPDENIAAVTYANDKAYSQLYFSPNLVELYVYGLYRDLLAMVDTLSISVDDNTPWASADYMTKHDTFESKPHPTIFNVSLGFKIIERPNIYKEKDSYTYEYGKSDNETRKYDNYFTGYAPDINGKFEKNEMKALEKKFGKVLINSLFGFSATL